MADSPIKLATNPGIAGKAKDAAVRYLRQALEDAERGEIIELIMVAKKPNGSWRPWRTPTMNTPEMVGRLEILKQELIDGYLNSNE